MCSRVFSYGHICFIGVNADVLCACLLNSDWSTSLGFSLYTLECVVEIISLLKLGDSMVEIIFCFVCEVISSLSVFFSLCRVSGVFRLAVLCLAAPVNL